MCFTVALPYVCDIMLCSNMSSSITALLHVSCPAFFWSPSFLQISPTFCFFIKCISLFSPLRFFPSYHSLPHFMNIHIYICTISNLGAELEGKHGYYFSECGLLYLMVISYPTYFQEGGGALIHCWWNCNLGEPLQTQYNVFSKQLKLETYHSWAYT